MRNQNKCNSYNHILLLSISFFCLFLLSCSPKKTQDNFDAATFDAATFDAATFDAVTFDVATIEIHTDAKMSDSKKVMASFRVLTNSDTSYNGFCGIEYHGNSTLIAPKKSFEIELRNQDTSECTAAILHFPAEEDFILLANYYDRSFVRNALALKLWESLGHYAPRYHYCTLILNGENQGLYMLVERIKVDSNRVDLLPKTDTSINADNNPFLLKLDWEHGLIPSKIKSIGGGYINYAPIFPKAKRRNRESILKTKEDMEKMETSLWSILNQDEDGPNYQEYIDVASFVDYFLITELSKNPDGFKASTYVHRGYSDVPNQRAKIKAGPVWDFDLAFCNVTYDNFNAYEGWAFHTTGPQSNVQKLPVWWHLLTCDPAFIDLCTARLQVIKANINNKEYDNFLLDLYASIKDDITKDEKIWNEIPKETYQNLRDFNGSNKEHLSTVLTFLNKRILWMEENLHSIECINLIAQEFDIRSSESVEPDTINQVFRFEIPSEFFGEQFPNSTRYSYTPYYEYVILSVYGEILDQNPIDSIHFEVSYKNWNSGEYYIEIKENQSIVQPTISAGVTIYYDFKKLVVP